MKYIKWSALAVFISVLSYWCLIEFPEPLFEHQYQFHNLSIASDQPLPQNIEYISQEVYKRLSRSVLFQPESTYRVFLPTTQWRWQLLSMPLGVSQVGGFNIGLRHNAFIRPSEITNNRIIPPGKGLADAQQRDLVYFISHEIMHGLMFDKVGYLNHFLSLPQWLQEGYPDYIAKDSFDFQDNLMQFQQQKWRLSHRSGLYVRYHLYLAYLLDVQQQTLDNILQEPPAEDELEHLLKMLNTNKKDNL